jgi:CspA family cold shock protein
MFKINWDNITKGLARRNGTVKYFHPVGGYGYITPDDGGENIYVHRTAFTNTGLTMLKGKTRVSFVLATIGGSQAAVAVELI